jgi:uncharacterized protein YkwD
MFMCHGPSQARRVEHRVRSWRRLLPSFGLLTALLLTALMGQAGLPAPTVRAAVQAGAAVPAHVAVQSGYEEDPHLERYAVNIINTWRQTAGLAPYKTNWTLTPGARTHSELLLTTDPANGCPNFHQCPGEPDWAARIRNTGLTFTWSGENVGRRWQDRGEARLSQNTFRNFVREIHDYFMAEGPGGGHYDNIMSTQFREVGVGVVLDDHHLWLTEDFIG